MFRFFIFYKYNIFIIKCSMKFFIFIEFIEIIIEEKIKCEGII